MINQRLLERTPFIILFAKRGLYFLTYRIRHDEHGITHID